MKIAQIAPIVERVPPKKYGGTERVVYALTEELVKMGHQVTLFASGDTITSARLVAVAPKSLREMKLKDPYGATILSSLIREYIVGLIIGSILGTISAICAYIISRDLAISLSLGISLLISMSLATVLACLTPIVLKSLGKDPAVGSGPFTTAIQDMMSLLIYFSVAMTILNLL